MSEQAPRHEQHEHNEHLASHEKEASKAERDNQNQAEKAKPDIEAIHHKIEAEAKSGKEIKVGADIEEEEKERHSPDHYIVTRDLKQEALKRSLQRARKHMTATSRAFSKTIHQPVVDAVSKVGEKTIARPTGILTGAIVALIGTSYVLYSAKHYGYRYNYLVVFILFVGGYLVGLIIEILIYALKRLRS